MKTVVIIPAFNEGRSIALVVNDIPPDAVDEIVVVNNASTDETENNAKSAGATVLREDRRGYGWACLRGIAYAREKGYELVVFLDGDYSDFPDELPLLTEPIIAGKAEFVVGSRMIGDREPGAMLPQAVFGNRLASFLMKIFWGGTFTDLGPFRAITMQALDLIEMEDKTYGWTVEMQIKILQHGLRYVEIPVSYRKRVGVSKITGTVSGTVNASAKILGLLFHYGLLRRRPRG
ncbi:MAG: glycosyltransferase family 2 protein [Rhodothermales bacterium]|nr:glycosyltransferase family 2 protein [Rhodothermales bacterium]